MEIPIWLQAIAMISIVIFIILSLFSLAMLFLLGCIIKLFPRALFDFELIIPEAQDN